MRAHEFINESKEGKLSKRQSKPTRGMNKFRDANLADRIYELNRVMMAAASTDGTFSPDMDRESWAGRYDIATPYTKVEQEMLKRAYEVVGAEYKDLNHGDLRSQELDSTYTKSPVVGFKGFKK